MPHYRCVSLQYVVVRVECLSTSRTRKYLHHNCQQPQHAQFNFRASHSTLATTRLDVAWGALTTTFSTLRSLLPRAHPWLFRLHSPHTIPSRASISSRPASPLSVQHCDAAWSCFVLFSVAFAFTTFALVTRQPIFAPRASQHRSMCLCAWHEWE